MNNILQPSDLSPVLPTLNSVTLLSGSANSPRGVNGIQIGADRSSGGGRGFNGVICEVLLFDYVLSTFERETTLYDYIQAKWGTP